MPSASASCAQRGEKAGSGSSVTSGTVARTGTSSA
ncbi:Uncharacterised protein [Mycobacteroides abscessus]|nr:Uncharacterised protein [Mycobacteroides abscessus]